MLSLATLGAIKLAGGALWGRARRWLASDAGQLVLIALLVIAAAACFSYAWRLDTAQDALRDAAVREAQWQARAAESERAARAWEGQMQQSADRAREHADAQRQTIRQLEQAVADQQRQIRVLRAESADADRLRQQLAAYAAGDAADTLATCRARAGGLAELLAEGAALVERGSELVSQCGQLARESAVAAQERAVDQDALHGAWPR